MPSKTTAAYLALRHLRNQVATSFDICDAASKMFGFSLERKTIYRTVAQMESDGCVFERAGKNGFRLVKDAYIPFSEFEEEPVQEPEQPEPEPEPEEEPKQYRKCLTANDINRLVLLCRMFGTWADDEILQKIKEAFYDPIRPEKNEEGVLDGERGGERATVPTAEHQATGTASP